MKNKLVTFVFILLFSSTSFSSEPFSIKLAFNHLINQLRVDIDRLSKDEVNHAFKKFVVYKNGVKAGEVDLKNQNYLNHISKGVVLQARAKDVLRIELFYGQNQVLNEEIIVSDSSQVRSKVRRSYSVLVPDETEEIIAKKAKSLSQIIKDKEPETFGYIREDKRAGEQVYGYKLDREKYGYTVDDVKGNKPEDHGHFRYADPRKK